MNRRIKAYIFDMDGTLVDNCAYHVQAWVEFSRKYGNELLPKQILDWMGAQGAFYLERIFGRRLSPDEIDRYSREKEEIYRRIYKPVLPEGLLEWLNRARAEGVKIALATGGPSENVAYVLDSLQLRSRFEAIVDASMYSRSKPAPDCFLAAAKMLKVPPGECRVYEDAFKGIEAAKAAGMECHAVTFTNSREALAALAPDFIFDSYAQLLH